MLIVLLKVPDTLFLNQGALISLKHFFLSDLLIYTPLFLKNHYLAFFFFLSSHLLS